MKEAVDDIMVTLNEAASEVGLVGGMVESIAEAMGRVSIGVFSATRTPLGWLKGTDCRSDAELLSFHLK